ncbi:exo1 protein [Apiospora phragmitis]|uniref:Exo1 protein n=1 Tax=Apiospora phragmitis TaxID=2905665 RepID=A0ABR1TU20_9PEZI
MGISGLLPLLKSIQKPTELKKFKGETLGVDGYGWLHRGAISCAIELAEGKPTRKYVYYVMNRVRMMQHFGVNPYIVFDGDFLPSKAGEEASRAKRREESKASGLALLKAGKPSLAHRELQKAIDITPEMARAVIEELKKVDVPYIVAPYEADPQLVYLERQGIINGILSEDSDLLVFGAKRLITKLDQHGACVEINRRDFGACREITLTGWSDEQFRHMAILHGCDYLGGIKALGLKTAYRMLRKHKTPEKVVKMLQFDGKYRIPPDYLQLFHQAELTFLYQRVYCPKAKALVFFTPPSSDIDTSAMPFIGGPVEPEMARRIADGCVNPMTKAEIVVAVQSPDARKRRASSIVGPRPQAPRLGSQTRPAPQPPAKPIDSYFNGHSRIPLGNMDTNCFSTDTQRTASLTNNGQRPIVFPLPRPYIEDEALPPSQLPRPYTNQPVNSRSQVLRRRTEPISNLLLNDGATLGSTSRRETVNIGRVAEGQPSTRLTATARPPKKTRLCDDAEAGDDKERSKFFPAPKKEAKRRNSYLMSDDSVEEAMKELPDIDSWHSAKSDKGIMVFKESSDKDNRAISKDDEKDMRNTASAPITGKLPSATPLRSAISRFTFNQSQQSSRPTPASTASASSTDSTPMSSMTSSTMPSTNRSTPATPLMTPLQRIGSQALNRAKGPATPSFTAPRQVKRSSKGRKSLDNLPVNASFVPLPPVDLEEVESLHQTGGSEDMIIPDSENEEADNDLVGQENMGKVAGRRTVDLSRFLYLDIFAQ